MLYTNVGQFWRRKAHNTHIYLQNFHSEIPWPILLKGIAFEKGCVPNIAIRICSYNENSREGMRQRISLFFLYLLRDWSGADGAFVLRSYVKDLHMEWWGILFEWFSLPKILLNMFLDLPKIDRNIRQFVRGEFVQFSWISSKTKIVHVIVNTLICCHMFDYLSFQWFTNQKAHPPGKENGPCRRCFNILHGIVHF